MKDDSKPARSVAGRVKWFDPARGFGFVVTDDIDTDILLHANVLRNFGQGSVADGASITLSVQATPRGMQAIEVTSIEPPPSDDLSPLNDLADLSQDVLDAAVLEPARVKWFDKAKGFGFANVYGRNEDVFVHFEVLRRSGLADLAPGEAVALRVVDGKRGKLAAEIAAWEAAPRIDAE
jgi:CspA family cold shock protein